jgi:2,5-diketo-D-gluconate reductase A
VVQAYSPLTRGKRLSEAVLKRIAERYGKSPAQILIRWNLQRGTVPLPKANRLSHLEEDIDVFGFSIEVEDIAKLNQLNSGYSPLGPLLINEASFLKPRPNFQAARSQ